MSEIRTFLEFLTAIDDKPLRLEDGQPLFTQGQPADGRMFIVRSGTIVLRSGRKILDKVGPGGILGEMALIDPAPRSATAVAGPGCTVSAVTEPMFRKLVTHVPGLALEMMRILARRLRQVTAASTKPRRPRASKAPKRESSPKRRRRR